MQSADAEQDIAQHVIRVAVVPIGPIARETFSMYMEEINLNSVINLDQITFLMPKDSRMDCELQ